LRQSDIESSRERHRVRVYKEKASGAELVVSVQQLRIYAIADIHSPDDFCMPKLDLERFDLVLTLGDIGPGTLDYIREMSHGVPCLSVLGNHDPAEGDMPGLENLHGRVITFRNLRLGGCGGAPRYKDAPNHYTERQVVRFLSRMPVVDVFVSHAPPPSAALSGGMVTPEDFIHRGFDAFDAYLRDKPPRFWVHGHLNRRYSSRVGATTVFGISGSEPLVLDFPSTALSPGETTLPSRLSRPFRFLTHTARELKSQLAALLH
jgi:hypothetical protein